MQVQELYRLSVSDTHTWLLYDIEDGEDNVLYTGEIWAKKGKESEALDLALTDYEEKYGE